MVFQCINIRQVPREVLKTAASGLGFQHLPRDLANVNITKTCLFKCIENFISKQWKFSDKKKSDILHISAQNIDCEYSLEPPRWGGSNEYSQAMFF